MIAYWKGRNSTLFKELDGTLGLKQMQNYTPMFKRFFELNDKNWNRINFDNKRKLKTMVDGKTATLVTADGKTAEKRVFFKMSPLLDPSKYLAGLYEDYGFTLPTLNDGCYQKISDHNNAAYVDGFFYYLMDVLPESLNCAHTVACYGNYLAIKSDFVYNVEEDLEPLMHNKFFKNKLGTLFKFKDPSMTLPTTCAKLTFEEDVVLDDLIEIQGDSTEERIEPACEEVMDRLSFDSDSTNGLADLTDGFNGSAKSFGSNSSDTNNSDSEEEASFDTDQSFSEIQLTINQFPVQAIALEHLECTLDTLLSQDLNADQLASALIQIVMTLIAFQHMFHFTHNDLHTNNVMCTSTAATHLYYCFKGVHYKVPTYGRVFKIIDFGRAIFSYKGQRFISDSFSPYGDAATQYNTEPYMVENKPRLEPNYSFDLCRLGCSLLDVLPDTKPFQALNDLIAAWCTDDKGRNMLYKKNGVERYPNFKLYKMIARSVHNHTPQVQLEKPIFKQFQCDKNECNVFNLDELPSYWKI